MDRERSERVRDAFARADAGTAALRAATSLACPPGCGACCLSPEVETTVAEVEPLARALVEEGRAGALIERLADAPAPCALYVPEPDDPRRGRCSAYRDRPLVCRLFGFSARRDRQGQPELLACRTMRAGDPDGVARAARAVAAGEVEAPVSADLARALVSELPGEAGRLLPINVALARALERELLRARLEGLEETLFTPVEGDDDPLGPPLGSRPAA